jgi:gamma-glutamylcysteine synthetase
MYIYLAFIQILTTILAYTSSKSLILYLCVLDSLTYRYGTQLECVSFIHFRFILRAVLVEGQNERKATFFKHMKLDIQDFSYKIIAISELYSLNSL